VKLLRGTVGAPETCLREFLLASAVDADCTARALGFGMSPAAYHPSDCRRRIVKGSTLSTASGTFLVEFGSDDEPGGRKCEAPVI